MPIERTAASACNVPAQTESQPRDPPSPRPAIGVYPFRFRRPLPSSEHPRRPACRPAEARSQKDCRRNPWVRIGNPPAASRRGRVRSSRRAILAPPSFRDAPQATGGAPAPNVDFRCDALWFKPELTSRAICAVNAATFAETARSADLLRGDPFGIPPICRVGSRDADRHTGVEQRSICSSPSSGSSERCSRPKCPRA
jgi:hypothetical protein